VHATLVNDLGPGFLLDQQVPGTIMLQRIHLTILVDVETLDIGSGIALHLRGKLVGHCVVDLGLRLTCAGDEMTDDMHGISNPDTPLPCTDAFAPFAIADHFAHHQNRGVLEWPPRLLTNRKVDLRRMD
jgi:hypothetical protein